MEKKCIVITNPMIAANKSSQVTLSKFLRVISACYRQVTVIGGNVTVDADLEQINLVSIPIQRSGNKLRRMLDILLLQLKMAVHTARNTDKHIPVYFWVADKMLIPFWAARLKKGDLRFFLYGNVMQEGRPSRFRQLSGQLIAYMANHADSVCVESPSVLRQWEPMVKPCKTRIIHLYTPSYHQNCDRFPEPVIGMLCRLTEGKHVLESIEAFTQFHKIYPNYSLEIIGSGRQEEACKALIDSKNAREYVRMLGWIDHEEVAEKTARWEYLLFPTDTEGMPNSVIEMMAMGVPVIASPVGGIPDIIEHEINGWLLPGTSDAEIYRALCYAVEHSEHYSSMSEAAWQTIGRHFTLENARKAACKNI